MALSTNALIYTNYKWPSGTSRGTVVYRSVCGGVVAYDGVDGPDVECHIAEWDGSVHRQLVQRDRLVQEGSQVPVDQVTSLTSDT